MRPKPRLLALLFGLAIALDASAARTLEEYRYFRALSIDLVGRMPARAEIAAFEAEGFDLSAWIEQKLQGPMYAERLRRAYLDLLRLEIGGNFQFVLSSLILRRRQVLGPDGQPVLIYYREGQRRPRVETDGVFCLTQAETGLQFPRNADAIGTPIPVSQEALDANTVLVKPWWLYRDYRETDPAQLFGQSWTLATHGFAPVTGLLAEQDGGVTTVRVRVCKEEALTAETGTVFATGRTTAPPAGTPPPYGRLVQLPLDSVFARQHAGEPISCTTGTAFPSSADCGCGSGLERCMPGDSFANDPRAFTFPTRAPLGFDQPFDQTPQAQSSWNRFWWGQEAVQFLDDLFLADRDLREALSGRHTRVNGPLAQFYRSTAGLTCCGNGTYFNYVEPEPLVDHAALPALPPHETGTWVRIDRGPRAAGILTMPIFLTKYGTRRARAHIVYNAFLCKEFVAGTNVQLTPSTEPNLMIRPGCSTCHASLEPLSAYFSRIVESDWTYLPPAKFPVHSTVCRGAEPQRIPGYCRTFYDPAFTNAERGTLRGAYASAENAEAGPAGLAAFVTGTPDFPACVAKNLFSSFLGRAPTPDDAPLLSELSRAFVEGGYRMRAAVRALLRAPAYRRANNLLPGAWRQGGAP
jgi:hypothetical protein